MTLRQAYDRADIARHGWSFERAMADPTMRRTLELGAAAMRPVTHRVSRYSDTLMCSCGKQWTIDDEPPEGCTP